MNPDSANLLDDVTRTGNGSGDFLIRALHVRRQRRTFCRLAALCVLAAGALAMLAATVIPGKRNRSIPVAVTPPAELQKITGEELLDSFPGQPVALVKWPDGRQQLLAIAQPVVQTRR
jgi:hypothetical protein